MNIPDSEFNHDAKYYEVVKSSNKKDLILRCNLCPNYCILKNYEVGKCLVRKNIEGKLKTLVYNVQSSIAIDPIEKKPLYHFLPNSKAFSIGTVGCNFHCKNCQNFDIAWHTDYYKSYNLSPQEIVELAKKHGCKSIAYTYNEPTIFLEQVLEIASLAKKKELKNIFVTNGYINEKPQNDLLKVVDAVNLDIKGFNEDFYEKICRAKLAPVLEAAKRYAKAKKDGVHLEVTRLVIPKYSDNLNDFEKQCKWHLENLGKDVPLHISKFHPACEMMNLPITSDEIMFAFEKIAKKYLTYVHLGNM